MLSKTGAQNIERIEELSTSAATYRQEQNWRRAERLYTQLLPLLEARYGLCHERVLYAAEDLANVRTFLARGSKKQRKDYWMMRAISAYEIALKVLHATLVYPGSPVLGPIYEKRVSHIYWEMGELCAQCKRDKEAVKYYRYALWKELWTPRRDDGCYEYQRPLYAVLDARDEHGGLRLPIWVHLAKALLRLREPEEAAQVVAEALLLVGDSFLAAPLLEVQEEVLTGRAQQARVRRQKLEALLTCPTAPTLQDLTSAVSQALLTPCTPVLLHLVAENRTLQISLQEAFIVISRVDGSEAPTVETLHALRNLDEMPFPVHVLLPDRSWRLAFSVTRIHYDTGHVEICLADGVEFRSPRAV